MKVQWQTWYALHVSNMCCGPQRLRSLPSFILAGQRTIHIILQSALPYSGKRHHTAAAQSSCSTDDWHAGPLHKTQYVWHAYRVQAAAWVCFDLVLGLPVRAVQRCAIASVEFWASVVMTYKGEMLHTCSASLSLPLPSSISTSSGSSGC